MTCEPNEEWYLNKAESEIQENKLEDAELTLKEAEYVCSSDRITSLLASVLEQNASSNDTPMAQNNLSVSDETPDMTEKQQNDEQQMMRNVFIMHSKIIYIQLKVAKDKIQNLNIDGYLDTMNDTEKYREKAEEAFLQKKYEEADHHILKAEEEYSKMALKLFPVQPRKDEKPSEEYLRMKRNKASSNHAGVTVVGNKEDVLRCIDNAKKALAKKEFEKARKWLAKSQRIFYTSNAQELLTVVEAAIAARNVPDETQNINLEERTNTHEENPAGETNTEQQRCTTPQEPSRTVHSENVEGAKMYLDKANKSLKMSDFDKAKHFLLKAKRMDSSIDVEGDLKQVHDAMAARNTKSSERAAHNEVPQETESPRPEQTIMHIYEANTYFEIAKNAYNDKNYDRALVFLNKADELYSLEHASNLRKKVKDKMTKPKKSYAEVCFTSTTGRSSKPTSNKKNDLSATLMQKDINHVKFNEAEKKLQASPDAPVQRARKNNMLETERTKSQVMEAKVPVESKKQVESKEITVEPVTLEDCVKPKEFVRPEKSVESVNSVEPEQVVKLHESEPKEVEKLIDIHANEATKLIHVAEKAYYDGELEKAERLLKKAERLYPMEPAKLLLETVNVAIKEKNKMKVQAPEHKTIKYSVVNELTKHEEKVKQLQPNDTSLDQKVQKDMLRASMIKDDKETANKKNSTPESKEGPSMKTQNRENVKSTSNPDPRVLENKNSRRLQEEHIRNMTIWADILKKLCEEKDTTKHDREHLVKCLREKHGESNEIDEENKDTRKNINKNKNGNKKNPIKNIGKGHLRSAEEAFIKGNFKDAKKCIAKKEVHKRPYVTDLVEIINNVHSKNRSWLEKILNYVGFK